MINISPKLNGKYIDIVGVERHFLNDLLHREDGPAIIYTNGTKYWFLNGKLHREDGPAVEYPDGNKYWYYHGEYHRKDGPAIERVNNFHSWFYHGKQINCKDNDEFLRKVKLISFY